MVNFAFEVGQTRRITKALPWGQLKPGDLVQLIGIREYEGKPIYKVKNLATSHESWADEDALAGASTTDFSAKASASLPGGRYRSEQNPDGTWNVYDVPIMGAGELPLGNGKPFEIDRAWLESALAKAKISEAEGYASPLHVNHHETGEPVEGAGQFVLTEIRDGVCDGEKMPLLYANLIRVQPYVYQRMMAGALAYRSFESVDVRNEGVTSLALMAHQPPRFKLPLLIPFTDPAAPPPITSPTFALAAAKRPTPFAVSAATSAPPQSVADSIKTLQTMRAEIVEHLKKANENKVREAGRGLLPDRWAQDVLREGPGDLSRIDEKIKRLEAQTKGSATMTDEEKKAAEEAEKKKATEAKAAADGAPADEEKPPKWAAAMMAAITAGFAGLAKGDAKDGDGDKEPGAPKPGPVVTAAADVTNAALQGRVAGLEAQLAGMTAVNTKKEVLAAAELAVKGYAVPVDTAKRIATIYSASGKAGVEAFVAGIQASAPKDPVSGTFSGAGSQLDPDFAAFASKGPNALQAAQAHAATYDSLTSMGVNLGMSREAYLKAQFLSVEMESGKQQSTNGTSAK